VENVFIGTSGWSYKDWVGPFYPPGTKAAEYLSIYASHFPAVEIDSTFYGIPRRETVEKWATTTPESFRFTLKAPGDVTHGASGTRPNLDRVLRDEDGVLKRFLDTVAPLGDKLGVIVFQFPYFRVKEMAADDFLERLDGVLDNFPTDLRCAVEIRNKGWVKQPFLDLLKRYRAAAVMIDHPYMPPPSEQLGLGMVTTDFAYVRLLGDRYGIEKITKSWGETVVDKSRGISDWAALVKDVSDMADMTDVYTFANNHYAGHGPATCQALVKRVAGGDFPS
jgi:uncharacterized protein YecE (DUF72 family)